MALSTPAEKEAARLKKQQRWNADRVFARDNNPDFVKRENAATHKSNTFAKNAKQFARAHIAVFQDWLKGTPVAPSAQGPQSHMLSPAPVTTDQPPEGSFEFPAVERPDVYGAISSRDETPTAPYLERRRLQLKPDNVLTQIGIDMR
jgi:hypothetical protein